MWSSSLHLLKGHGQRFHHYLIHYLLYVEKCRISSWNQWYLVGFWDNGFLFILWTLWSVLWTRFPFLKTFFFWAALKVRTKFYPTHIFILISVFIICSHFGFFFYFFMQVFYLCYICVLCMSCASVCDMYGRVLVCLLEPCLLATLNPF